MIAAYIYLLWAIYRYYFSTKIILEIYYRDIILYNKEITVESEKFHFPLYFLNERGERNVTSICFLCC